MKTDNTKSKKIFVVDASLDAKTSMAVKYMRIIFKELPAII